jgi:RNA-directed DNA polymerase
MSLRTPQKVRKLQEALHAKAKESPDFRFYALYDKVYRADVLEFAYRRCRLNGGAAGVDGERFEDIEAYGVERWLGERTEALRKKTYQPHAVRRVWIPKPDGSRRPLGIPTVRDRVVQTAVVLVLEPIFEADLQPEQYAYRPGRSALDAVQAVHGLVNSGHTEVVDADLKGYFDEIPHAELMKSVARRVSDGRILHLIKMWLQAPVEEIDDRGRRHRTTPGKDRGRGCPQGAPISPLLANLYMRRFILGWKALGHEGRLGARVVTYADDLVLCCRGTGEQALATLRRMMQQLKLPLNEAKTRLCRVPEESVDFLGYTIGRCYSPRTGRAYIGTRPSRQSIQRVCRQVSEMTGRRWLLLDVEDRVRRINRLLQGWSNYFHLGPVSKAYRSVDQHTRRRLRQWLRAKHKVAGSGISRFPDAHLYQELSLIRLQSRTRDLPWANA